MTNVKFDLALFESLNAEYASKPLVPRPRSYAAAKIKTAGRKRAAMLAKRFDLAGKRVLEIGCGRGEVLASLGADFGCACTGVDVTRYADWDRHGAGGATFLQTDLSRDPAALAGEAFDFIVSFAAWEHIHHPHAMLARAHGLLRREGEMYLIANLHRGPKASHRYREVFFPWPHLLFQDAVFEQFYIRRQAKTVHVASWVNRLTVAHYLLYFEMLGFERRDIQYRMTPIDEDFYARFEDILGRYPRFDLERDFIEAHLRKP